MASINIIYLPLHSTVTYCHFIHSPQWRQPECCYIHFSWYSLCNVHWDCHLPLCSANQRHQAVEEIVPESCLCESPPEWCRLRARGSTRLCAHVKVCLKPDCGWYAWVTRTMHGNRLIMKLKLNTMVMQSLTVHYNKKKRSLIILPTVIHFLVVSAYN